MVIIAYLVIHFFPLMALGSALQKELSLSEEVATAICVGIWLLTFAANATFPLLYGGIMGCVIAGMVFFSTIGQGDLISSLSAAFVVGIIGCGVCIVVGRQYL